LFEKKKAQPNRNPQWVPKKLGIHKDPLLPAVQGEGKVKPTIEFSLFFLFLENPCSCKFIKKNLVLH
jgi:hypothetical protein